LEDHGFRPVPFHNTLDNRLKDALVRDIIDTIAKWEIDGIVFALAHTDIAKFARSGEVFSVFVERDRHDTICSVEGFLNTIAVVHIDIDVENALLEP